MKPIKFKLLKILFNTIKGGTLVPINQRFWNDFDCCGWILFSNRIWF